MREPLITKNGRNVDLRSHLLEASIIKIDEEFTPHMASTVILQLLYLDTLDSKEPVQLYISSPGGCVVSGLAIYDTIQKMKRKVSTIAVGMAASMGAFLLACGGEKGSRYVMPNAQVMFHEVSSRNGGRYSDMEVSFQQTTKLNNRVHELIAKHTGKKLGDILKLFEKDIWLEGKEVVKFGAADIVL